MQDMVHMRELVAHCILNIVGGDANHGREMWLPLSPLCTADTQEFPYEYACADTQLEDD